MNEFDDPFSLQPQSRPSGRRDEEGREIRLVGPTVSLNHTNYSLTVHAEYATHPLINGRYFYTLPPKLLEALVGEIGEERFDAELLTMERKLSAICERSGNVGFRNGIALQYGELQSAEFQPLHESMIREAGMNSVEVDHAIKLHAERDSSSLQRFAKGYCGWLMTNQQFLDEHVALISSHTNAISCWGIHHPATNLPESYCANMDPGSDSDPH